MTTFLNRSVFKSIPIGNLALQEETAEGKQPFLKLLLGEYEYAGTISSSVTFEYFPFPVEDTSANTLEVIDGICHEYEHWSLVRELSLLDLCEDVLYQPFGTLSNGEQTKVLLATLFLKKNHFLLIDEPTNHLDVKGRELVCQYLNSKRGFILISHDRAFLDGCVDHILSINRTSIDIQQGNFSSWLINKERQDQFELAENQKLKKQISRLEASATEKANWSDKLEQTKYGTRNSGLRPDRGYIGHKAAKMMKRSKSIEQKTYHAMEEKAGLLKNLERADDLKIAQLAYHTTRLASLDRISIAYGEKLVCENVSFQIERGDRIALTGKNGSGKSSILKLICGEEIPYTGTFEQGSQVKISYVSQDTSFLRGSLSTYAKENGIDESLFKAILRKMDFQRVQFEKDMSDFSGGQKKKVLIAKSLFEKSHLLIWDEPLNFIDVISRMQIESLLLEYQPTIVFVEHDRVFCDNIATKVVYL